MIFRSFYNFLEFPEYLELKIILENELWRQHDLMLTSALRHTDAIFLFWNLVYSINNQEIPEIAKTSINHRNSTVTPN